MHIFLEDFRLTSIFNILETNNILQEEFKYFFLFKSIDALNACC